MATPKLTPTQLSLNKLLKSYSSLIKSFTYYDYQNNPTAQKLEALYISKLDNPKEIQAILSFSYYLNRLQIGLSINDPLTHQAFSDIDMDSLKHHVATLFGLAKNYALVEKLLCEEYAEDYRSSQGEHPSVYEPLIQKLKDTCTLLAISFRQYKADETLWARNPQAKKDYIKQWEMLCANELFKNESSSRVKFYYQFLQNNYGLNQQTKAKADALLALSLPNVSTLAIAKEIIETSSRLH